LWKRRWLGVASWMMRGLEWEMETETETGRKKPRHVTPE